jgi:hypothetical protein
VTILNTRDVLTDHLNDNPSLRPAIPEAVATAYRRARRTASVETGLAGQVLPLNSPWSFDQIMAEDFWPGEQP